MSWLTNIFTRNSALTSSITGDEIFFGADIQQRAYLKYIALEICINFIARTISQADFRISQENKRVRDDWDYLLNVRPNTDNSASDFWHNAVYKLLYENEVLIIKTNDDDLLIADSFERVEYAVYPDIFRNVTVKDYTFARTFPMNEVIYLTYNNEKLTAYMHEMFKDFTDIYSRMVETEMFSNQIRALAGMDSTSKLDGESLIKLQGFIDKMYSAFKNKAFAIVPKMKGFDYEEIVSGDKAGRSISEVMSPIDKATEHVAKILGIPPAVVNGNLSDYETALKAYIKFTYEPLLKRICDELNTKIVTKDEYQKGKRVKAFGIRVKDVTENAEAVDKLVASGAYTRNEVREKFGDERVDDKELDKYVITKNYQAAEDVSKGGESK